MCGIVAIFDSRGPVNRSALERAVDSIQHRGPDSRGIWAPEDSPCGLGHQRLAIIDLQSGQQPLASPDGSNWLVANGEFYDHERILDWLRGRGLDSLSRSDSEVPLALYREWGIDCLPLLRGEFAFALWDQHRQRLFVVRDRFGIKPLFYAQHGSQVIAASEIKALLAAGVPSAWDGEGVQQSLHLCLHQDRTLFRGVRQLPAGHYLLVDKNGLQIHRYWDQNYPSRSISLSGVGLELSKLGRSHTFEKGETLSGTYPALSGVPEALERVSRGLHEAVKLRVRSDVPIAAYLSGGVDSSAVLGLAQKYSSQKLSAFTIAFDHPDHDESEIAGEMCRSVGADFHRVSATQGELADAFDATVCAAEAPIYNGHAPARWLLSRAVHQAGFKVVLGGEGADELFAGYRFSQIALNQSSRRGLLQRLLSRPSQDLLRLRQVSPVLSFILKVCPLPPEILSALTSGCWSLWDLVKSDQLPQLDPYRAFLGQFEWRRMWRQEPVKQILYLWMKSAFVNYILAAERLDMAHAVEVRLPFLDHHLFESTRSFSSQLLNLGGQNKALLRQAVAPYVTRRVLEGPKQPFIAPMALQQVLKDKILAPELDQIPFLDGVKVRRLVSGPEVLNDALLHFLASLVVLQARYRL